MTAIISQPGLHCRRLRSQAHTGSDLRGLLSLTLALVFTLFLCRSSAQAAARFSDYAAGYRAQLKNSILPYWQDSTLDAERGGFILGDSLTGKTEVKEKQLVSQARLVWTFSYVHRKGYSDSKRDYLKSATHGYQFLLSHFQDPTHGGFFWKTDLSGKTLNSRKILYGEAFVIYAFVEYYRASGDRDALQQALALFRLIQEKAHDRANGGWFEHFLADWTPILKEQDGIEVEIPGLKSANAHLHLMEALAELVEVSHDSEATRALEECLKINQKYFYPRDPARSAFHKTPDWKAVDGPRSAGLSYGHNVEFAWLMIRAEQVLGRRPSWDHFDAHLDHTLRFGYDHLRGGVYLKGVENEPAVSTDKVWWVQAEMLAAFSEAYKSRSKPRYNQPLFSLLDFLAKYQADPKDGIWLDTVTAEGKPKVPSKANLWKANYHDVRAIVKFIETFEIPPQQRVRR